MNENGEYNILLTIQFLFSKFVLETEMPEMYLKKNNEHMM